MQRYKVLWAYEELMEDELGDLVKFEEAAQETARLRSQEDNLRRVVDEREEALWQRLHEAVAAERERCAKILEDELEVARRVGPAGYATLLVLEDKIKLIRHP